MTEKLDLTFVSQNKNKFLEYDLFFSDVCNLTLFNFELIEIQAASVLEIAEHKLNQLLAQPNLAKYIFIDDTALEIDALDGMPGPYIKWFLQSMTAEKIAKLTLNSPARAICTIGLANTVSKKSLFFKGELLGTIVEPISADTYGWDGIFKPLNRDKTFAMMDIKEKVRSSHRNYAATNLRRFILNNDFKDF